MQSWKRGLSGRGNGSGEVRGGREKGKELELSKMDALVMQVSRVSRNVTEVKESCLCIEELISKEEKEQPELESQLRDSTVLHTRSQQHAATEFNLQSSIQLIRDQLGDEEKENEKLEEEMESLFRKLEKVERDKRAELGEIKAHYGSRLLDREKIEQQKKITEMKQHKTALNTTNTRLKQEKQKTHAEWKTFVEAVVKMTKLARVYESVNSNIQESSISVRKLQTAIHSLHLLKSSKDVSKLQHSENWNKDGPNILSSSPHVMQGSQLQVKNGASQTQHSGIAQHTATSILDKQTSQQLLTPETPDIKNTSHPSSSQAVHLVPSTPKAAYSGFGAVKLSCSPCIPTLQAQDITLSRQNFSTNLSLLKLPYMKLRQKRKIVSDTQDSNGRMPPIYELSNISQVISLSSSQTPLRDISSTGPSSSVSEVTISGVDKKLYPYSVDQHNRTVKAGSQMWTHSPDNKGGNLIQETRSHISSSASSPKSFPLDVSSSTKPQVSETFSLRPRGMPRTQGISSLSPKIVRLPRNLGVSLQKFKNIRAPIRSKGTGVSRTVGVPHRKARGVGVPLLLPRGVGAPPPRCRDIGIVTSSFRDVCPNVASLTLLPHQKACQRYIVPRHGNTEFSRLMSSSKAALQEFSGSLEQCEEASTPTETAEKETSVSSSHFPETELPVLTNTVNDFSSPSVPTTQEETTPSPNLDNSSEMAYSLHKYLKIPKEPYSSSFMETSSIMDTSQSSSLSVQTNKVVSAMAEEVVTSRPITPCSLPTTSVPAPSPSPAMCNLDGEPKKTQSQSQPIKKSTNIKSPQLTLNPLLLAGNPNGSPQNFKSNSTPVDQDSTHPFIFQNESQNSMGVSLFESPGTGADSPSRTSNQNSGSSLFLFEDSASSRTENAKTGIFSFNLGSDGESVEDSGSSFFSSLFDSSQDTSTSEEGSGFCLF